MATSEDHGWNTHVIGFGNQSKHIPYNINNLNNSTNLTDGLNNSQTDMMMEGLPLGSKVVLILLYSSTMLLSVVGNLLVILVFTLGWRSRTDLRWFLINLAVADLVMAMFCMPFTFTMTMLGDWIFTEPMCPIVLYMQTVSVTVSVFTNMAIGIDRFWVVLYPLKSRITKSRSKVVIAIIWIVTLVLSSVQLIVGRVIKIQDSDGEIVTRECMENWEHKGGENVRRVYTFFILLSTYIVPVTILSLTYGFVGWKLCKRTAPGNADEMRDTQQLKSKRRVIKMLVVVVLLFGICWLPLHVFILVIDFNPHLLNYESYEQMQFFNALYYSVHWLAMSNSFVNPIIYGFLNDSFRHDLRRLLRMWFPCLVLCFACLRDPTLSRGQTMRGLSYYEQKSVSDCGGGSTKRRGQAKSNLHVKMNGYGKCKTDISPEKFHLQPSSKSTCLYSKVSSDNERSDLS